jgi:hypothetical protein
MYPVVRSSLAPLVIPAKAGIPFSVGSIRKVRIPAFAGMTVRGGHRGMGCIRLEETGARS